MDEYIKREDAKNAVCFGCNQEFSDEPCEPDACAIRQSIMTLPTADVVPKSEVERLEEELSKANADVKNYMKVAEYQQSLLVKRYHEIKRLKEDVDRLQDINNHQVENVRLAKADVAREISEELEKSGYMHLYMCGLTFTYDNFCNYLAKFKKKYEGDKI